MISTRPRFALAAAVATTGILVVSGLPAAADAGTAGARPGAPRVRLHNTRPSWAVASRRVDSGTAATGSVGARVYLAGRDPAGLSAYSAAVSDPASPEYGRYLTAAQVQQRYGPSDGEVDAVQRWLTSAGLQITAVTPQYVAATPCSPSPGWTPRQPR
jgi:hypothetical protein